MEEGKTYVHPELGIFTVEKRYTSGACLILDNSGVRWLITADFGLEAQEQQCLFCIG